MSHELRTPLNSLLILARLLSDNSEANLTQKQVDYARTIYSSGNDLLALINDILDLAKIESGTMSVEVQETLFSDLHNHAERIFRQVAVDRKLDFNIQLDARLPRAIYTDTKRLQQVVKNLLANAFKFTEKGQVSLNVSVADSGWSQDHEILKRAERVIAFAVADTGIGIALEKQQVIFEAFQQADGTTSRKYGGTGLGLSISREIARLLGGEIRLVSELGGGSTFTLYLPQAYFSPSTEVSSSNRSIANSSRLTGYRQTSIVDTQLSTVKNGSLSPTEQAIADDRETIQSSDRTLLIVEDDLNFARILLDMARQQGFKGLVAGRGDVGLAMAREYRPAAIMLDIRLP
jgi:signal transduction histidine kinase